VYPVGFNLFHPFAHDCIAQNTRVNAISQKFTVIIFG
jgi:hypothetical protein